MRFFSFFHGVILSLFCLLGCGQESGLKNSYSELKASDTVVKIGSASLTKGEIEVEVVKYQNRLKGRRDGNMRLSPQEAEHFRFNFVQEFINRQLLVVEAKRVNVIGNEEFARQLKQMIETSAKQKKQTRDTFLASVDGNPETVLNIARNRILINAYIQKYITTNLYVSGEVVSNYMSTIARENAGVTATNKALIAKMEKIRADVLSGKAIFTNMAEQVSDEAWDLGEMEREDFESVMIREAIFTAQCGSISKVIEDDDSVRLYQIAKIIPATKDKDGLIKEPERRVVYQIQRPKEALLVELSYEDALSELKHQMVAQRLMDCVESLKTNGLHRVVWPHGDDLWGRKNKRF